jgi:hypothetical protein
MKDKTWVGVITLFGSLASYYYAKTQSKDVVPYVMIGTFLGTIVGEIVVKEFIIKESEKENSTKENSTKGNTKDEPPKAND